MTRKRQYHLTRCGNCGGKRRLDYVTTPCQCTWGEGKVATQRFTLAELGHTFYEGQHWHGAWLCVTCRNRSIDYEGVAMRSGALAVVNTPAPPRPTKT